LARTAALEFPERWGGIIDLEPIPTIASYRALVIELLHTDGEDQIALHDGVRRVARLVPRAESVSPGVTVRSEGAYLITGGSGALGLHVAKWLVSRGAKDITLVSRRGLVDSGLQLQLDEWKSRGATVSVVNGDVSCAADVERLVGAFTANRPLRGIVHAAGIDHESRISDARTEEIQRVLAPKLMGGWFLDRATRNMPLDFFICFSSISAVIGSTGHAHYAAANAFLDQLCRERRRLGLPALSIAWGPWAGGGMADEEQLRRFEAIGNRGLNPSEAIRALDHLAGRPDCAITVADLDWDRFLPAYEARRTSPLMSSIRAKQYGTETISAKPTTKGGSVYPWVEQLRQAPPESTRNVLLQLLKAEIAATLGLGSADSVSHDRTFVEMGMDSLLSVDFASRLQRNLGIRGSAWIFDYPRLDDLTTQLLSQLDGRLAAPTNADRKSPTSDCKGAEDAIAKPEWIAKLSAIPEPERLEILKLLIRAEVARLLGFASPEDVALDKTFSEMGMDSLLSVGFASRLQKVIGIGKSTYVFDFPFVEPLATQLLTHVDLGTAAPAVPMASASASEGKNSTLTVVGYTKGIEPAVYEFFNEAFPHRTEELAQTRWRWMFLESASRLAVEPRVWLARDQEKVVGHHGSIPVKVKIGKNVLNSAWHVDTRVLEQYWSQAVGGRLMAQATDDLPFSLSLGQTVQSRQMIKHLGWQQVATLQIAHFLIHPERVLQGKLSASVASAAGLALRASRAARDMFRSRAAGITRTISEFDARHDKLWNSASMDIGCAVVRDASYLNWKWVSQPGQELVRIEQHDGNACNGVAVLMFRDPDRVFPYRRAFLVDLVVRLSDRRSTQDLISAACQMAAEHGADSVVCMHTSAQLGRALRGNGFMFREPTRYLLVSTGGLSESDREMVLTESNWFLTQSDSDIDRPE
jgi:NAD(P)-dependent dehydrogenase (short-subunit alcohol dehydrogenase family)/acyl carrier protein